MTGIGSSSASSTCARIRFASARPGCTEAATDVDHRDGSGPDGDNSWANLAAMAHGHHSSKTVRMDGGFGRPKARRT
jgi:hypothetical protein